MTARVTTLIGVVLLAGCGQVVRVHTARDKYDLGEYRHVIEQLDLEIVRTGYTSGAAVIINDDHCVYTYAISRGSTAADLRRAIESAVRNHQERHPGAFRLLAIKLMPAHSAGVRYLD